MVIITPSYGYGLVITEFLTLEGSVYFALFEDQMFRYIHESEVIQIYCHPTGHMIL